MLEKKIENLFDILITDEKKVVPMLNNLKLYELEELIDLAFEQSVGDLLLESIKFHIPDNLIKKYKKKTVIINRYKIYKIFQSCQISSLLKKNSINHTFIKGEFLSKYVYDSFYVRPLSSDIDILIAEKDFFKANKLFHEMGCKSNFNEKYKDVPHLIAHEVTYSYNNIIVEIKLATSSILNLDVIEKMMRNSIDLNVNGVNIKTLDFNHTLILLISNVYSNIEEEFSIINLKDILDIYYFINNNAESINWNEIYNLSEEYKLTHKVYAILNEVNPFFNRTQQVCSRLFSPHNSTYKWDEYDCYANGWMKPWESTSLLKHCVSNENKIKEFHQKLRMKAYSEFNKNYKTSSNCGRIYNDYFKINLAYNISFDEEYIFIEYDYTDMKFTEDIEIVMIIFDKSEKERCLYSLKKYKNEFRVEMPEDNSPFFSSNINVKKDSVKFAICKKDINNIKEYNYISYRIYILKKYYSNSNYAIRDERETFDFNNPSILSLE